MSEVFNVMSNSEIGGDEEIEEDDSSASEEAAVMANMMAKIEDLTQESKETRYSLS